MTKRNTTLLSIVISTLAITINATPVISADVTQITDGGGGGDTSTYSTYTEISQSVILDGIRIEAHLDHSPTDTWKWEDSRGIIHIETQPESSNGWVSSRINQGALGGRYFVPTDMQWNAQWNEQNQGYNIGLTFRADILDSPSDWKDLPRANTHIDLPGLNLNMSANAQHYEEWTWDPKTNEGHSTLTNDIDLLASFWIEDHAPVDLNLNVRTYDYYWQENDQLQIRANFFVEPSQAQAPVPEPATLSLLTLGGIGVLLRRRRRS